MLSAAFMLVDLSIAVVKLKVTVSVAVMQLEVSAVTYAGESKCSKYLGATLFIDIMQVGVSAVIMQVSALCT